MKRKNVDQKNRCIENEGASKLAQSLQWMIQTFFIGVLEEPGQPETKAENIPIEPDPGNSGEGNEKNLRVSARGPFFILRSFNEDGLLFEVP